MRRLVWLAAVIVAMLSPGVGGRPALVSSLPAAGPPAAAAAPPSGGETAGVIRGRVIDRTAPAHPVAAQPVRLQIVERGTSSERQTRTDTAGAFVFSGLPVGGLRIFLVSTQYQGVLYEGAQRILLTPAAPVRDLPLAVYDAGADRRILRGTLLFAVVDVVPGALRVTTVEQVQNPTDRTVMTTPADPLAFPLPRDAVAVSPLDGWRDPHTEDGRITDARSVVPGVAQLTYAYQERPHGGRAALVWAPPFGAARVEILVADARVRIATDGLRAGEPVTASGRRYAHWSGGPVEAGETVALRLDGLPAGGDRWPGVLAAALAAVLAMSLASALLGPRLGAVIALRRPFRTRRRSEPSDPRRAGSTARLAPSVRDAAGREGEARDGVEAKFPAHISPRAAVRLPRVSRGATRTGMEESESACPPDPGDGVSPRRWPS